MSEVAIRGHGVVDAPGQGERFVAPLKQPARFSEGVSRHHKPFYDDYNVAKMHILQAIGDISELDIFGRQVLLAVFCRPNQTPAGLYLPIKEVKEDWYQTKGGLILKMGPGAFKGDDSYIETMFGDGGPPQAGEWVFANASAGIQIQLCGDGASRPQGLDMRKETMDIFEWDGWPCRLMDDTNVMARIVKPHTIV